MTVGSTAGRGSGRTAEFPTAPLGQGPAAPGRAEMRSWGDEDGIRDTHPFQLSARCMGREGCTPSAGSIFQKSVQQHSSAVLQTSWWIDSSWDIFLAQSCGGRLCIHVRAHHECKAAMFFPFKNQMISCGFNPAKLNQI